MPSKPVNGEHRGWIIPIGGAEEKETNPRILARFVELSGGADADITSADVKDLHTGGDLFRTEKLGAVPVKLPLGVSRAHYLAYKNLAHAAAPKRVKNREMEP